ncbi:hypothetical protein [Pseudomonas sp.]|uniref:hypothetical protein n=1 Tax=Pseudomonas sp. TaxID=306 RepID=UPI0033406BF9
MAVVRIVDLTAATTPLGTGDLVEIEQGGNSRRCTVADIRGAAGLTNPMTTAGDIITGGASGVPQRLGIGANGQTLTVVSGAPAWAAAATARDAVTALTISTGVVNIDCALGDFFTLSLTANVTSITFSNLPASGRAVSLALRVRQDGTGGRTVALPSSFRATTGSDTAVQSAANAWTLVTLTTFDQGTRWEYTMRGVAA